MAGTPAATRPHGGLGIVPSRRRFTVEEYYRMAEAGILGADERVELLDGEIYTMSPIGSRHAGCVGFGAKWFIARLGDRSVVRIQNPVRLGSGSEPEPDIALLRPRPDDYRTAHPGPEDVHLIIEVADSSLAYDTGAKLRQYAEAGIPELWVADLGREQVRAYREPRGARYRRVTTVGRGGSLSPAAFPDLTLAVTDLFGPAAS